MKCVVCGGKMKTERRPYRYMSLPTVVLQDAQVSRCVECGEEEVAIPRIAELNRVITAAVVRKVGRLTGDEFRFLRKGLGWSSADLARVFGTKPETVSRWERGKQAIGLTAEKLLRHLAATEAPVKDYSKHDLERAGADDTKEPMTVRVRQEHGHWRQPTA